MPKLYYLLKKESNNYTRVKKIRGPYKVECSYTYPTMAYGTIAEGTYAGDTEALVGNANDTIFYSSDEMLNPIGTVIDCRGTFFCSPWNDVPTDLRSLVVVSRWLTNEYVTQHQVLAITPETFQNTETLFYVLYTSPTIESYHIDTTNFGSLTYPYFFLTTSGENPKFYQKDECLKFGDTAFVERSTNLPSSEITIIRADDLT